MSETPLDLDIGLAWKRVRADLTHGSFVRHPFEQLLIEADLGDWIDNLKSEISDGRYCSGPMTICDVPKGKGAIRPGSHLGLADKVVFAAYVSACLPYIHQALSWSQGTVDYSYQLSENIGDVQWLRNQFDGWKNFDKQTLGKIESGFSHVVFTDITGYYENITIEILMSDLRQTGSPHAAVCQLSTLLNRWGELPGRGLPQGQSPSDILGKLYLNSVDESLRNLGIVHLRYVDDFRILCGSEVDAKAALMELSRLLRKRGLSLQTAKTSIMTSEEARERVEGLTKILLRVRDRFLDDVKEYYEATGYLPFAEAERLIEESAASGGLDPKNTPIQVIQEAFDEHFDHRDSAGLAIEPPQNDFDKSLFHFLLNRLGIAKDESALDCCLSLLSRHPEETTAILKYLERIDKVVACDDTFAEFMNSAEAIYGYQKYQIAECRIAADESCSEALLAVFRKLAFNHSEPAFLRSMCRALVGKFGTLSDLENLQYAYSDARGVMEQCEILCCLKNMESNRRNAFLGRHKDDSKMHLRAFKYAKG